jgi:hypothetical protein
MTVPEHRIIKIDVGAPRSDAAVHAAIEEAIGRTYSSAGWYGLAWCLDEYPTPVTINLVGFESFQARSPLQAKLMIMAFRNVVERRSGQGFVVNGA